MTTSSTLTISIDSSLKSQFEALCDELNISPSYAVTRFVEAMIRTQGFPFATEHNTNAAETWRAIDEAIQDKGLVGPFRSAKEVMNSLNT